MERIDSIDILYFGSRKQVAEAAGVSAETVRKVLGNLGWVSNKTSARVLTVARQMQEEAMRSVVPPTVPPPALDASVPGRELSKIVASLSEAVAYLVEFHIREQLRPIQEELSLIKSLQSEWVDTREALRMTGLKQAESLKAERERPGTSLVYKIEGKGGRLIRYLRSSIIAYNERKIKRRVQGITLAT